MKRIYFFTGLLLCMWGCNKSVIIEEGEKVVVSIGLGGEITMSQTPLSKATGSETSSQDLYAINVYYDKNKDGAIGQHYAYGIFDNTNDMVITLLSGYKYKFECTYVPNGKAFMDLYYGGNGQSLFSVSERNGWSRTNPGVHNEFVASENLFFTNIKYGLYSDSGLGTYGLANADRFYGELNEFSPKAGERAVIDMTRCVFGIKINVSGLTDGFLTLGPCFGESNSLYVSENGIARDEIRSFRCVYDCWYLYQNSSQDYSVTESMSINWTRGNGVTQDLGSQSITIKRNVLTTVNISLTGTSSDNSIGLNVISGEMGNSTVNININADGTVDTNVDPQH